MKHPIMASITIGALLAGSAGAAEKAAQTQVRKAPATAVAAKAPPAPAMRVFVDPVTGELLPAPAAEARAAAAPAPDLPPLAMQESPVTGGGKMVVLDDRFMLEMSATVAPNGEVRHLCQTEEAKGTGAAKESGAAKAARPSKEARRDR